MADNDAGVKAAKAVEASIAYFAGVGRQYKALYFTFAVLQMTLAAAIPVFALLWKFMSLPADVAALLSGVAGGTVAALKGLDGILKTQETWLRASATASRLRGEQLAFDTRCGAYAKEDGRVCLYVTNYEGILESETTAWQQSRALTK